MERRHLDGNECVAFKFTCNSRINQVYYIAGAMFAVRDDGAPFLTIQTQSKILILRAENFAVAYPANKEAEF